METTEQSAVSLTRESLYEAVWQSPIRTLALTHGCSDRGLAKLCARYRIPVPPRGYWAKLAAGHCVQRVPLPALSLSQRPATGALSWPASNARKPPSRSVAAQVADAAETTGQRIRVADTLRNPHPLVSKTKELFESARADDRSILHPDGNAYHGTGGLAVHVAKASIPRALRIADALVKAVEAKGWGVRCPAKSESRDTGVLLLGHEIAVSIEEKVRRFDRPQTPRRVTQGHRHDTGRGPYVTVMEDAYPRYGYEPLGLLALRVPGYGSEKLQIADGTTQRLEDRLDEFLVGVVKLAEQLEMRRRAHEEYEQQQSIERRRREAIERQRAAAAARVATLDRDVAAWRQAQDIRAYVAAARECEAAMSTERATYLEWALDQADAIDPLCRTS